MHPVKWSDFTRLFCLSQEFLLHFLAVNYSVYVNKQLDALEPTLREGVADGGGQGGAEGGIVDELRVLETALVDVPRFFVSGAPLSDHYGLATTFAIRACADGPRDARMAR